MSTFDRSITIPAPPKVTLKVLRAELGTVTEDRRKHLLVKALPDGVWAVYYWQPDGKRATYLRCIVTPLDNVAAWLSGTPNLIRALDELKLPITDEAKEAGYEQLDAITAAVSREKTAVEGWLWSLRQRMPILIAVAIAGIVFGPVLLQQVTNQPAQMYDYTFTLPGNWTLNESPVPLNSCWTNQYLQCEIQLRRRGTELRVSVAELQIEHLIIYSPVSAYDYYWRELHKRDRDLRVISDLTTYRTRSGHAAQRSGQRYLPVNDRKSFTIIALKVDSDHFLILYVEGEGYELAAYESEITQIVNSIQLVNAYAN